ncbi:hypothetical protein F4703DRAFT_1958524 [Phycomyces blakesleeanus]
MYLLAVVLYYCKQYILSKVQFILTFTQHNYTSNNEDETEAEDNEYNGRLQDNQVFNPYFGYDVLDHDSFYNSITNSMSSFDDKALDAENDPDTAETDTNTDPANIIEQIMKGPIAGCHPFPDLQTMVLCALVDGNNDMVFQRMMKKILFAMNMISKIQANTTEQGTFKLPKLNALMNYHQMKKNRIPVFPSTKVDAPELSLTPIPAYINLPSLERSHLCLTGLLTNPSVYSKVKNGENMSYTATNAHHQQYVKVEDLDTIDLTAFGAIYVSCELTSASGLSNYCYDLLYKDHCFKRLVLDSAHVANSGLYYKVRIAPIILFTDDTSGNQSKQFNPYESWSMKLAGLSYEERLLIANILFLLAIPKKNVVSGMSFLPALIRYLKKLKNDIIVYSAKDNTYILLMASLLWIEADTPCHSELCDILGPAMLYPCCKHYILIQRTVPLKEMKCYLKRYNKRTKEHYVLANSTNNRTMIMPDVLNTGKPDTMVEILYAILLGIAKYLINRLVKITLKKHADKLEKLSKSLKEREQMTRLSCRFIWLLRHCGSFLGRDYKVLLQTLPAVFLRDFANDEIESHFEEYLAQVDYAVNNLIKKLHKFDTWVATKEKELTQKDDYTPFCNKPKVHFLNHLTNNIRRFGPAFNYETEKGEQFNKHSRASYSYQSFEHLEKCLLRELEADNNAAYL